MQHQVQEITKNIADMGAVGSLILVLGDILPSVVLIVTIIWTCIRVYSAILDVRLKRMEIKKAEKAS